MDPAVFLKTLKDGIPLSPLPPKYKWEDDIPHAPILPTADFSKEDLKLALRNALRYFPRELHNQLAPEFVEEFLKRGHIYMYRFRPAYPIRAYPLELYPAVSRHAAAIQMMIMNNLDPEVAQFPAELVTYGTNGTVFQNWAQYHLTMRYLSTMTDEQTLCLYSGHPHGLFPSSPEMPRMIVTNGLVIPNYSSKDHWRRFYALGVSQYGQMTAGSFCFHEDTQVLMADKSVLSVKHLRPGSRVAGPDGHPRVVTNAWDGEERLITIRTLDNLISVTPRHNVLKVTRSAGESEGLSSITGIQAGELLAMDAAHVSEHIALIRVSEAGGMKEVPILSVSQADEPSRYVGFSLEHLPETDAESEAVAPAQWFCLADGTVVHNCYIGPQGIVHGTMLTVLNAGRKYLRAESMKGKVFVSAGLGGMSGAQPKASTICGAVSVIAEVDLPAIRKRHAQGWVMEIISDLDKLVDRVRAAKAARETVSIAYHGNVVDLWECFASIPDRDLVDLGSDQTSLHNAFAGGYWPVGMTQEESRAMMREDPETFKERVRESLRRHVAAINTMVRERGMKKFFDYGNAFLLEAGRAGADIFDVERDPGAAATLLYRYPSYVQDIMGDIFSLGFGPFRWVCTSGNPEDLAKSDRIASDVITRLMKDAPPKTAAQYADNKLWIDKAGENKLVVGSQARILYVDALGRMTIAEEFNKAIASGHISAPIVLSRDHHDVSGTDSPFRETSNITDGSQFTADMATHNVIGDAMRGATWVALHNGGGVGFGEVTNGGFGHVLDGSEQAIAKARRMLFWDVNNGITRRAWARNENALEAIRRAMDDEPRLRITLPTACADATLEAALSLHGRQ
eukprot:gnl/Chilomastix_cuspidata/756.p1 GENE.gnl/Chilomastix_cuspidata/756~~gnl/Chilomastix_cuspidata/756.p1  ORF type:complete len:850 (-),score=319.43 gnl/Chilomastix_cuspidata/756:12-2561(-)